VTVPRTGKASDDVKARGLQNSWKDMQSKET
jgi:hypothetical protein